ncbi:DUF4185 domain-containing protein [Nocardia sp. BMG111209]|uniref:DUF4185 domain-containing protein n=1 Tax=Nocardia sp. BMG111209 TaxID=1160137 RepID=UPI0003768E9F|nr:DUF4185 domain-containing protein [Nocardia sp. BMG111209]
MGLSPRRTAVPALFGVLASGVLTLPAVAEPAAWAPRPVNACGEIGFDPLSRKPDPLAPPAPLLPPSIDIPVPVPKVTMVPVPGPKPDNTRIDAPALPADPCGAPCPDVRNSLGPDPAGAANLPPFALPQVQIKPEIEPIPIPVPGGDPQPPEPPPAPVVHPAEPGAVAPAVPPRQVRSVELVNQVTGHGSVNRTDVRYQVDGTDLGLMWETKPGEVAVVFGDTFGKGWQPGGAGAEDQDWRSNVLGYSTGRDLSKGLVIDSMVQDRRCHAAELLDSRKIKNFETTTIPTSGFALGSRQFLTYMSINHWSRIPGMWITNRGGLAYSDDDGRTWVKDRYAEWDNVFGTDRFQVGAMVPHGDHVYLFGTPNGRVGVVGLARVAKSEILNKSAYQYWVDGTWAPAAENSATPLFTGLAGELSARFDDSTQQWQLAYLDPLRHAIVLRTAAQPQGTWTDGAALIDTDDYPTAYGGFIHPWSSGRDLYFTVSAWNTYNVYLMHATLDDQHG